MRHPIICSRQRRIRRRPATDSLFVGGAFVRLIARTQRLRDAELEANKAMEEERQRLEKELKNDPLLVDEKFNDFARTLDEETKREIDKIKKAYEQNKGLSSLHTPHSTTTD